MLFSYGRIMPSLVFYSGKVVQELEGEAKVKKLISDQECSQYVVMNKNDFQKRQEWVQKEKLHAVCQNNTHVLLEKD